MQIDNFLNILMENIIFFIIGLLLILIFLASISIIHMRTIRDDINIRWYNLVEKLQYRQDLVPNLIETLRSYMPEKEITNHAKLINNTIDIRARATRNSNPGASKVVVEHDLSRHILQLMNMGAKYNEVGRSTNYLELKKDFADLNKKIEARTNKYNERVRIHNEQLARPYNYIPAKLMRYGKKYIFEFE